MGKSVLGLGKTHTTRKVEELKQVPGNLYIAYCTRRIEFLDLIKHQIQSGDLKPEDFLSFIELLKEDIKEREAIYEMLHDEMKIVSETAKAFERKVLEHNQIGFQWTERLQEEDE